MKEAKFTKGPWVVSEDSWLDFHRSIDAPNHGAIALILSSMSDECDELKNLELKANANLIACAPDMYEMLKLAMSLMDGDSIEDFTYQYKEIEQLLKRARGE